MQLYFILFIIGSLILTVIANIDLKSDIMKKREQQTENLYSENRLMKKLEELIEEKISYRTKSKIEKFYLQAGLKTTFIRHVFISIISAIVCFVSVTVFMNNLFLGFAFLFIGYFLPYQAVSFLRNKRLALLDNQIGAFMKMVIKRYETTKDFALALRLTTTEFEGEYPLYTDLEATVNNLDAGMSTEDALSFLALSTGNKFLVRLADYYSIVADIGTEHARKNILNQAHIQFVEDRKIKRFAKKEIAEPVKNSYMVIVATPLCAAFQALSNPDYLPFMTQQQAGKIGTTVIAFILFGAIWFVNAKVGAPLD